VVHIVHEFDRLQCAKMEGKDSEIWKHAVMLSK